MSGAAPVLMVQGTASGVGKSWLTMALCRAAVRRGLRVAPFKAQNMSNNAAVTLSGGEVGRAQALQARAARVEIEERMNPVLLKPVSDRDSDVVVLGRSAPDVRTIPWRERRAVLWPVVCDALGTLRRDFDLVVAEGAGSPAEINLRDSDIVNMAVAHEASARVLLVADIDRGGAFASLYGSWGLLDPGDRALIDGFVLNRFRGDPALLAPAPERLFERTGVPVVGVVPWVPHMALAAEDAASIRPEREPDHLVGPYAGRPPLRVAAVRLPHVANFDDLDPLAAEDGVEVRWVTAAAELFGARVVVIPGTRNTIADLLWLRASGLEEAIARHAASGGVVVGLCGGLQMLGHAVRDPHGVESGGSARGLGLLALETLLAPEKSVTRVCVRTGRPGEGRGGGRSAAANAWLPREGLALEGYEIHLGRTRALGPVVRWEVDGARHGDGPGSEDAPLGWAQGSVWGTYLHGIFDNDAFREAWLDSLGVACGGSGASWSARVDAEIDAAADAVEAALDVGTLLGRVGCEEAAAR